MKASTKRLTALAFYLDRIGDVTNQIMEKQGNVASARLQIMPALNSAKRLGLKANILSLHSSNPESLSQIPDCEICLVCKLAANSPSAVESMAMANLAAITRMKRRNSKIVMLYCDNLLHGHGILSELYQDLFKLSDYIIYPSSTLKRLAINQASTVSESFIINDPWQITKELEPRELKSNQTCRLLWYGSDKNIRYLIDALPDLMKNRERRFEITILGSSFSHKKIKNFWHSFELKDQNWLFRLVPWNKKIQPQQLETEIYRSHIVIIPSNPNDPLKAGVSHNRLVDALRGGSVTIASPMESYKELDQLAILGNNMSNLLTKAIHNYDQQCLMLVEHRHKHLNRFNPESNNRSWIQVWEKILKN